MRSEKVRPQQDSVRETSEQPRTKQAPRTALPNFVHRSSNTIKVLWRSPRMVQWRVRALQWSRDARVGTAVLLIGTLLLTLLIIGIDRIIVPLPNAGFIYLPLVAMLAYYWGWRHAFIGGIFQLFCAYYFFIPPSMALKSLDILNIERMVTLAAVTVFTLTVVQLARARRSTAEHVAERFAALNRIGTALVKELVEEERLLHLIAQTARDLTGAEFAAFTLRPVNELGQPLVVSEGNLFHLAAVVGVTKEQESLFRRMPLGGEGLLAPIFRHGVPVLVSDALAVTHGRDRTSIHRLNRNQDESPRDVARSAAFAYAHGLAPTESLRTLGVPRGHPIVRSFLGAPLLDSTGEVRGGLLLGHTEPDRFTHEDEELLVGLAAQAAVAVENARHYRAAQTHAQELDAIFESIADGVTLVDHKGRILRENHTARKLLETLENCPGGDKAIDALLHTPATRTLSGEVEQGTPVTIVDSQKETHDYIVSASPLRQIMTPSGPLPHKGSKDGKQETVTGAVVVWHDVTEAGRLLSEQRAHAETEAHRALLQMVIDELPSGVYLVRGKDARLVLANRVTAEVWGASWERGQTMYDFLTESGTRVFRTDGRPLEFEEFATIRAVRNGQSVRHHQQVIRHPDGTTLPVLVNAVAIDSRALGWTASDDPDRADDAREPAAIVVHQDVTALKQAEQLKDEFIGIAAHELRNPLAALKGFAQMLIVQTARGKGPELADWQQEAIDAIDLATTRLVELTEDLLDVTRLQAGRLELHLEPADLVALTQRVVARLSVMDEPHPISVQTSSEDVIVSVDRKRIEQVLTNIINNAIKYSPEGGNIEITIRKDVDMLQAMLAVRDYGIGIPADQQAHIFGRFMRADNARAREIKGTGLGLYLCRELVERHNGRIWFESTEGVGSTFFISLPLAIELDNDL